MSQPRLMLASGSPRRRELLEAAGYALEVTPPSDGAEDPSLCSGCGPVELVRDLATAKLRNVGDRLAAQGTDAVVVAADTVAECGGAILGKPTDEEHAAAMMRTLSGRRHRVYTGLAIGRSGGGAFSTLSVETVETTLTMDELPEAWIEDYVAGGLWRGKAGGFGYQDGLGFVAVERGSETNVVGLPMEVLTERLAALGVTPAGGRG
ncbi:MAG: Maf family protein [Planctomycetota bacterium]